MMQVFVGASPRFRLVFIATLTALLIGCGGGASRPKAGTGGKTNTSATPIAIIADLSSLAVGEGDQAILRLNLSSAPGATPVTVNAAATTGDADIRVIASPSLVFDSNNWNKPHIVTIGAVSDSDAVNGDGVIQFTGNGVTGTSIQVREIDDDVGSDGVVPVVEPSNVAMAEGTTGTFGVRLSAQPAANVTITVSTVGVGEKLKINQGAALTYTPSNWNIAQTVSLVSQPDADNCDDSIKVSASASNGGTSVVRVVLNDAQGKQGGAGFSLCGRIIAPAFALSDSDVNDQNAPYASNDTLSTAQPVSNPAAIGGYVNAPGQGAPGRSQVSGDVADFYAGEFRQGDVVTLHIASAERADLNLRLYNAAGAIVNSSTGTGPTESIAIAAPGPYSIEVSACTAAPCTLIGGSNYVLNIGATGTAVAAQDSLRLSDEFIPGELIVRFKDEVLQARALNSQGIAAATGLTQKAGASGRAGLFTLSDEKIITRGLIGSSGVSIDRSAYASDELYVKQATLDAVKALRLRDDVAAADPNYIVKPFLVPSDPLYASQWHYPLINLPAAWDVSTGSNAVTVAVIDTGTLLNHPDLQGRLVPGFDFIRNIDNAVDGNGIDSNPDDPGDQGPQGSSFHGTHVSGTIAAQSNNAVGVAGVAFGVRVMPLRVLGKLGGSEYDVQQAIRFASGMPNDSGTVPSKRVDVINMSFGGQGFSQSSQDLINTARAAGVIFVAASGNDGNNTPLYPASYAGVVSVSAADSAGNVTAYSSTGALVDIAAPGGDISADRNGDGIGDGILSTGANDRTGVIQLGYPVLQGTSMAAPHVAGVLALMRSVFPALTAAQVDTLMASGKLTDDRGTPGRDDKFGNGLLNALKAVTEARTLAQGGGQNPSPQLTLLPNSFNFGSALNSATLTINNTGGGTIVVSRVTSNQPWVVVTPQAVDPNGLGTYVVSINRSLLPQGAQQAAVSVVTSTAGTGTISILAQGGAVAINSNAGFQYIILVDPATHEAIAQTSLSAANGVYDFSVVDVPPGEYHVFGSTDSNQDNLLCDPGEACGAYTAIGQPTPIVVTDRDVANINFNTGFLVNLTGVLSQETSLNPAIRPLLRRD